MQISAQPTKAEPANTNFEPIADWFNFRTLGDPQLEKLLRAAHRFALELRAWNSTSILVLLGTSGAGKTHLARRIWRWFEETGKWFEGSCGENQTLRGQFVRWVDFIKECQNRDSSRLDDMLSDNLLIIDDIGAGSSDAKKWMSDKLFHILDHRIMPFALNQGERRKPRATIITANMRLEQLAEAYGERIASRLVRLGKDKVIEVETMDYALR